MITLKQVIDGWFWIWERKSWFLIGILSLILVVLGIKIQGLENQLEKEKIAHLQYVTKQNVETERINKEWREQLDSAKDEYVERIKALERERASLSDNANRLSEALRASKAKYLTASEEARIEYTNTVRELLETCSERYRAVAVKADEHANDAKLLSDAWPETKKPP